MNTRRKWMISFGVVGIALTVTYILIHRDREAHELETRNKIAEVLIASRMLSGDQTGIFGESIEELKYSGIIRDIPKFIYPDGSEGDFVFIGGFEDADPGDMVFIASPPVRGSKSRWVATVSGDIKLLPAEEAEQLLEKSRQFVKQEGRINKRREDMRGARPQWPPKSR